MKIKWRNLESIKDIYINTSLLLRNVSIIWTKNVLGQGFQSPLFIMDLSSNIVFILMTAIMSFVHGFPMGPPPLIHLFSVQSDTRTYLWSCVKASDLMLLSHGGYVYRRVRSCDLQTSTIPESPPSIMYCPSRLSIIVYKTQRNSIVTYHCKDKTDRHEFCVPYSINHKIKTVNHPLIQSVS